MRQSSATRREIPRSSRDFARRFSDAIAKRAYPNTPVHLKQLAGICGYSADAFMAWCRGEARAPGEAIDALVTYFDGTGDRAFLFELFGREREALDAEAAALRARLARLETEIDHAAQGNRVPVLATTASAATVESVAVAGGPAVGLDHQAGRLSK